MTEAQKIWNICNKLTSISYRLNVGSSRGQKAGDEIFELREELLKVHRILSSSIDGSIPIEKESNSK